MLVDSHCHLPMLDLSQYEHGLDSVFATARELGVEYFLSVSVDLDGVPALHDLVDAHSNVFGSVGVHPNTSLIQEPSIARIIALADHPDMVAIGETGLDYYRHHGHHGRHDQEGSNSHDLEWQRQRFRLHIRAARETGKPLIIHCRDARDDVIRIMQEERADEVGGVMHCFVDDWDTAVAAMDLNFYISLSGIVTFKNAQQVQYVAKYLPLERMLVETDSPYLAPTPYRGKQNQPGYVRHVADFIADLKNVPTDTIEQATSENFFKLFKIPEIG